MLYSRAKLSHLTAEIFALKDEAREPMVNQLQLVLDGPFRQLSVEEWQAATKKLFLRYPRLMENFSLALEGYRWQKSLLPIDDLVALAWSGQDLSLEEFRQQALAVDGELLLRFRFDPEEGLSLAFHHVLADGSSLLQLLAFLLSTVLNIKNSYTLAVEPHGLLPKGIFFFTLKESLRRFFLSRFNPPLFMGPVEKRFGSSKQIYLFRSLDFARIKKHPDYTLNDALLCAYHRALARLNPEPKRISILTSLNLRQWQAAPEEICNWSSNVPCETDAFERRLSPQELLHLIHEKMLWAKKLAPTFFLMKTLEWADRLGFVKRGRKYRLDFGTPSRIKNGEARTEGANLLDTAILSNMGALPANFPARESIRHYFVVAPVLPPTSIALGVVGTAYGVDFTLRASDCHFDRARAEALMNFLLEELQCP